MTERTEGFIGFGAPVFAPRSGTVVIAHDGELDHEARRSQLMLISYLVGQPKRLRGGAGVIAGNHVVIAVGSNGPFVLLAHLRSESLRVRVGDSVAVGQEIGQCGNSGNSTQPHVHVQVTDTVDWSRARGMPLAFVGAQGVELPSGAHLVVAPGVQ